MTEHRTTNHEVLEWARIAENSLASHDEGSLLWANAKRILDLSRALLRERENVRLLKEDVAAMKAAEPIVVPDRKWTPEEIEAFNRIPSGQIMSLVEDRCTDAKLGASLRVLIVDRSKEVQAKYGLEDQIGYRITLDRDGFRVIEETEMSEYDEFRGDDLLEVITRAVGGDDE